MIVSKYKIFITKNINTITIFNKLLFMNYYLSRNTGYIVNNRRQIIKKLLYDFLNL